MSYAVVDIELTRPLPAVRLRPEETGVALVSRRSGQVVGFALHALPTRRRLSPREVAELLDPEPVDVPLPAVTGRDVPPLSVVVCTRDRPDLLARCLDGLRAQVPPAEEILVVDNAPSDDRTRRLTAGLGVRYVVEPCPG